MEMSADSSNIPIRIGSVSEEGNSMGSRPTEEQWRATLARVWGDAKGKALADAMIKKYAKEEYSPALLWGERHQFTQ
jgi:para-nitrobenzyl esterase